MEPTKILRRYVYDAVTGSFANRAGQRRKGIVKSAKGYIRLFAGDRYYMAHHIVWLMHTGSMPKQQIDHINGDRSDNRLENLREVTPRENSQNQRRAHKTSKTGLLGVSKFRGPRMRTEKWRAQIKVDGRSVHLGMFDSAEEAHAAYLKAKRAMHPGCTI